MTDEVIIEDDKAIRAKIRRLRDEVKELESLILHRNGWRRNDTIKTQVSFWETSLVDGTKAMLAKDDALIITKNNPAVLKNRRAA